MSILLQEGMQLQSLQIRRPNATTSIRSLQNIDNYLDNNSTLIVLKSIKRGKTEVSILLQDDMQLQCLQIHRKLTLWLSCGLHPTIMLVVFIADLYMVGFMYYC